MFVTQTLRFFVVCAFICFGAVCSRAGAQLPTDPEYAEGDEDESIAWRSEPAPRALSLDEEIEIQAFVTPKLSEAEKRAILARYKHLDKTRMVPRVLLNDAILFYDTNLDLLKNRAYLSIIDYSLHSSDSRFFLIEVATGNVLALHVAHGSGSDKKKSGWAKRFSNVPGSNRTTLGFVRTAETYFGKHGLSLRLDGLSKTNSKMRDRAIVLHGAKYVWDQNVKQGWSWGCPAVSMRNYQRVVNMLKEGSLIYSYLSDP